MSTCSKDLCMGNEEAKTLDSSGASVSELDILKFRSDELLQNCVMSEGLMKGPIHSFSLLKCASLCIRHITCASFIYKSIEKSCLLYARQFISSEGSVASPNTSYHKATTAECPSKEGFIYNRSPRLCYQFNFNEKLDWNTAYQVCSSKGGHLLHIRSSEENDFITKWLLSTPDARLLQVSIGVSFKNGSWVQTSDELAPFLTWAEGEPSSTKEDCVTLASFYQFKMNDIPCSNAINAYICQWDV